MDNQPCTMEPTPKKTKDTKISAEECDTVKNYMVIEFGYSASICVPYEDGVKLLAGLNKAERISSFYAHEGIKFTKDPLEIKTVLVSQRDYRSKKMEFLLGLHDENV